MNPAGFLLVVCQGTSDRPVCPNPGIVRRQNTAYHEDYLNWVCSCDDCMVECDEYWAAMWGEYYAAIM